MVCSSFERFHEFGYQVTLFQYPFSGSMVCSILKGLGNLKDKLAFSIPLADRWCVAVSDLRSEVGDQHLSVSL